MRPRTAPRTDVYRLQISDPRTDSVLSEPSVSIVDVYGLLRLKGNLIGQ